MSDREKQGQASHEQNQTSDSTKSASGKSVASGDAAQKSTDSEQMRREEDERTGEGTGARAGEYS